MSKENVAKFIKTVAEKPDLNSKVAGGPRQTASWVKIANEAGFKFSSSDFVGFVSDIAQHPVTEADAVQALLGMDGPLDDKQLDAVAGGMSSVSSQSVQFSAKTQSRIGSQFGQVGDISASFVKTSGPSFVKSGSIPGAGGF